MQHKLIKNTMICVILFAIISLTSIVHAASTKSIAITDVAQDELNTDVVVGLEGASTSRKLDLQYDEKKGEYLCIPLPHDVRVENVAVENHYMKKELWVVFEQDYEFFYETTTVYANEMYVTEANFEQEKKRTRLKIKLTNVYEYKSFLEENNLYIEFVSPKEMYDKRVVIDPAMGGLAFGKTAYNMAEKNITLSITKILKEKLDSTDIKVYYTRVDDIEVEDRKRIEIATQVDADMLIRIEVNESKESTVLGTETVYNSTYFIPTFGSPQLADLLERQVVTAIQGKANGLVAASMEDYVIYNAQVPAAAIRVGYITNESEAQLLAREDYANRIAEGIYQAIKKAYEDMENQ